MDLLRVLLFREDRPREQATARGATLEAMGNGDTAALSGKQVEAISRAIADPRRYAMLQQIAGAPSLPCRGLQVADCLSPATVSHHLKELQSAGLVTIEREGRGVRLSLRRDTWNAYLETLASL